jgi:predicted peroxiredoxin
LSIRPDGNGDVFALWNDMLMLALGIEAEIFFVLKGKKIVANSPTQRGTPKKKKYAVILFGAL